MVGKVKTAARRGAPPDDTDDEGHDTGVDRRTPRAHKPVAKYSPSHQQTAAAVKKRARPEVTEDSPSGSESEEGKDSQRIARMKRARKPVPPQPPPHPASSETDRSDGDDEPVAKVGRAAASRPAPKPAAQQVPARGKVDVAASSRLPSVSSQLHSQVQKGRDALAQLPEVCPSTLAAISLALDAGDALLEGGADLKVALKVSGLNKLIMGIKTHAAPLVKLLERAEALKAEILAKIRQQDNAATNGTGPPSAPSALSPAPTPLPHPPTQPPHASTDAAPTPSRPAPPAALPPPLQAGPTPPPAAQSTTPHPPSSTSTPAPMSAPLPDLQPTHNHKAASTSTPPTDSTTSAAAPHPQDPLPPPSVAPPAPSAPPPPPPPPQPPTTGDPTRDKALAILTSLLSPPPPKLDPAAAAEQLEAELFKFHSSQQQQVAGGGEPAGVGPQYKRHLQHLWHVLREHDSITELLLLGAVSCQQAVQLLKPKTSGAEGS